jgi:hypothetical protein
LHLIFYIQELNGRKLLGRTRSRWESNIKINLSETGNDDVDWIYLAQDRDYGEFLRKRQCITRRNFLTDGTAVKFSITLLYGVGY